jgi:hypothetical protein
VGRLTDSVIFSDIARFFNANLFVVCSSLDCFFHVTQAVQKNKEGEAHLPSDELKEAIDDVRVLHIAPTRDAFIRAATSCFAVFPLFSLFSPFLLEFLLFSSSSFPFFFSVFFAVRDWHICVLYVRFVRVQHYAEDGTDSQKAFWGKFRETWFDSTVGSQACRMWNTGALSFGMFALV